MPDVADVTVRAKGDTSDAEKNLASLDEKVKGTGDSANTAKPSFLSFFAALAGVVVASEGFNFLKDQLSESIALGKEGETEQALLTNAIKATGNVSHQSAAGLEDMAVHLSSVTTFTKASVEGVETFLVRAKIPPGLFNETTQESLDMAQALGIQAPQAARLLSRALEDPAKAAGALRRENVILTQAQQDAIKTDIKRGDTLGAQKVVLDAVKGSFNGAAAAVGQTFAGSLQIMENQLNNTKEALGEALLPVLEKLLAVVGPIVAALAGAFAGALTTVMDDVRAASPLFDAIGHVFQNIQNVAQGLALGIGFQLAPAIKAVQNAFSSIQGPGGDAQGMLQQLSLTVSRVGAAIYPVVTAFAHDLANGIQTAIPIVQNLIGVFVNQVLPTFQRVAGFVLGTIVPAFATLAGWIISNLVPVILQLVGFFVTKMLPAFIQVQGFISGSLIPIFQGIWGVIQSDILPILTQLVQTFEQNVVPALESTWNTISAQLIPAVENLWNKISPILIPALQFVGSLLKATLIPAFQVLGGILQNVVFPAIGLVINIIAGLINGIATVIGWVVQAGVGFLHFETAVIGAIQSIGSRIQQFVGNIASWFGQLPGKLLQAGKDMMQAFINGVVSLAGNLASALGDALRNAVNSIPGGAALAHLAGIPGFAHGTSNAPGGLSLIGEGDEPELVVGPHLAGLPKGAGVYPLSSLGGGNGGGNTTVHVHPPDIYLDGELVARNTLKHTPSIVWQATGLRGGL